MASTLARVGFTAFLGTAIEFYDYFSYGTAAALVFPAVFFPRLGTANALLAAFSVYAVAFVARPLGSLVFGHFGDRLGRKRTLVVSLLLMGLATVGVGLLPGYAQWGDWAAVLLVLLRFVQGVGLGGEWGGAALLLAEHAPPGQRGRYGAYLQLGPVAGFLLANGVFLALSAAAGPVAFTGWAWRLPFLASAVLVAVGLFVRLRLAETPVFAAEPEHAHAPVLEVLRGHGRTVLLGAGALALAYALFYLTTTFALGYVTVQLGVGRELMLGLLLIGTVVKGVVCWCVARGSDRFGRRRSLQLASGLGMFWGVALFPLLETARVPLMALALTGSLATLGALLGPVAAYLPELFPTRVRYTGAALTYNLAGVLGGAAAPLLATRMTARYGTAEPVGWYLAGLGVLALCCLRALPETRGTDLNAASRRALAGDSAAR